MANLLDLDIEPEQQLAMARRRDAVDYAVETPSFSRSHRRTPSDESDASTASDTSTLVASDDGDSPPRASHSNDIQYNRYLQQLRTPMVFDHEFAAQQDLYNSIYHPRDPRANTRIMMEHHPSPANDPVVMPTQGLGTNPPCPHCRGHGYLQNYVVQPTNWIHPIYLPIAALEEGFAYAIERGYGQYTRLVPADRLPPMVGLPVYQERDGLIILPNPRPGGYAALYANVSSIFSHLSSPDVQSTC
jgi:hypothetical protein